MKGYKVSMKALDGRRVDCFSGYMKTREDAEKYAEWIGETAKIKEYEKKSILSYAVYDDTNIFHLRYVKRA